MVLGALVAAAVAPAAAQATATAKLTTNPDGGKTLVYSAPDSERNDIRVDLFNGALRVEESSSTTINQTQPVAPGPGCFRIRGNVVSCPKTDVTAITLNLGLKDDKATNAVAGLAVSTEINGSGGSDTLTGGGRGDTLDGGSGSDTLDGGDSKDTLRGGTGADTLTGGDGVDVADYGATSTRNVVRLDGARNDGADLNRDFSSSAAEEGDLVDNTIEQVIGGSGPDALIGSDRSDNLRGMGGDDFLSAEGNSDRLDGGLGSDFIAGGSGQDAAANANRTERLLLSNDSRANDGADANGDGVADEGDNIGGDVENIIGGGGPDLIVGNDERNVVDGQDGDDTLDGAGGDDDMEGDQGNDTYLAGPGADEIDEGLGSGTRDTVDYSTRTTPLRVSIGDGPASLGDRNRDGEDLNRDGFPEERDDVQRGIDIVKGGSARDILTATEADNRAGGGATLFGGGDADFLIGDIRNDTLLGGAGADDLRGGSGIDSVSYSDQTTPVVVTLDDVRNDGIDANGDGIADENDSVGQAGDVERVFGGSGGDVLTGNDGSNLLNGGPGQDRLRALGGADTVNSNDGVADLEISCGADIDTVMFDSADSQLFDGFPPDCEGGSGSPKGVASPILLSKRSVTMPDSGIVLIGALCPSKARGGRCKGRIEIDSVPASGAGALASVDRSFELGSSRYELKAGERGKLPVDLSRAGRALVKLRKDVTVEATATSDFIDARGRRRIAFTTLRILRGD